MISLKIAIIYNGEKQKCFEIADNCRKQLQGVGAKAELCDISDAEGSVFFNADVIAAVGGDGTILRVAKKAAEAAKPIIGINAGRLGYLACIGADDTEKLKRLVTGDFSIENRSMLKAELLKDGRLEGSCTCLNDAVISHGVLSTIIDLELKIDNDRLFYRGDGIIAATPSGSTAYSMSAGGPIVDPTLKCFIFTPVCPHTLQSRPLVVNDNKIVEISVDCTKDTRIYLSADGQTAFEIAKDCIVRISNSGSFARFIKLDDVSVYKVFSEKTNFKR